MSDVIYLSWILEFFFSIFLSFFLHRPLVLPSLPYVCTCISPRRYLSLHPQPLPPRFPLLSPHTHPHSHSIPAHSRPPAQTQTQYRLGLGTDTDTNPRPQRTHARTQTQYHANTLYAIRYNSYFFRTYLFEYIHMIATAR